RRDPSVRPGDGVRTRPERRDRDLAELRSLRRPPGPRAEHLGAVARRRLWTVHLSANWAEITHAAPPTHTTDGSAKKSRVNKSSSQWVDDFLRSGTTIFSHPKLFVAGRSQQPMICIAAADGVASSHCADMRIEHRE